MLNLLDCLKGDKMPTVQIRIKAGCCNKSFIIQVGDEEKLKELIAHAESINEKPEKKSKKATRASTHN